LQETHIEDGGASLWQSLLQGGQVDVRAVDS
jgi:hypothetical protein